MEECPKQKCPAGIPAWVLTFADLMSLLMCFFVLLLSFAEMDVQKYKQISGSLKMAFGVQREIKAEEIPKGINIIAKEFSPAPPQPTVINQVRQVTSNDTQMELLLVKKIEGLESEQNEQTRQLGKAETDEEREEIQDKIKKIEQEIQEAKQQLDQVKNKIDDLQAQEIKEQAMQMAASLKQEIKDDILEIETNQESFLIRIKDKGAFAAGSASLTDDFIDVLEVVKEELAKVKGAIIVAGHTDNIPINTREYRSNWDLSAKRSVSVVQELLYQSDIEPTRLSVQAFGESRPLVANDSAANRGKNRRVEIIVSKSKVELNSLDEKDNKMGKPSSNKNTNSRKAGKDKKATNKGRAGNRTSNNKTASEKNPVTSSNEVLNETKRPVPDVPEENDIFQADDEIPNFINF